MSEQRTEAGTVERRKKAKEAGDRPRSRELLSGVALVAGFLMLEHAAKRFALAWRSVLERSLDLGGIAEVVKSGQIRSMFATMLMPLAMVMTASFTGALLVGIAQEGGLKLHPHAIQFKAFRLSPLRNFAEVFRLRSASRVPRSVFPTAALLFIGWRVLQALMTAAATTSAFGLPYVISVVYHVGLDAAWVTLIWSGVDYWVEWSAWSKRMKMTKQEIKDERTQTQVNSRVRERLRQARLSTHQATDDAGRKQK